jgi:hypothetical protein
MMEYAEILVALGLMNHEGCLLVLDADPVVSAEEQQRSLGYLLRQVITDGSKSVGSSGAMKARRAALRLICLENDRQGIRDVMQAYIR